MDLIIEAARKKRIKVEENNTPRFKTSRQWPTMTFTGDQETVIKFLKERAHPASPCMFFDKT
jgi:hypothetical protein